MKNIPSRHFFIFSLIISFVLFLVIGMALHFAARPPSQLPNIDSKQLGAPNIPPQSQPTAPPTHGEATPASSSHSAPSLRITPQDTGLEPLVYYRHEGFSLSTVSIIAAPSNPSCILGIINETDNPLMVRLSPHHPQDDWGVQYPMIPAKDSGFIDPRYRIEKIAFHNFDKPEQEFSVTLDPKCLPQ